MKNHKLMSFTTPAGSTAYTLIDVRTGLQPALVCIWADYLKKVVRSNSMRDYLKDVAILLEWAERRKIHLEIRFASLDVFNLSEMSSLFDVMTYKENGEKVGPNTFNRRIASISDFIFFHLERYLERLTVTYDKYQMYEKRIGKIKKQFGRMKKGEAELALSVNPTNEITREQLDRLMKIASPDSELNPFKTDAIKYRNFCMFLASIECALRRSELVLLEVDDFEAALYPTMRIKKPSKANISSCKDCASLKTRGRLVPISNNLSHWIQLYMGEYRVAFRKKGVVSSSLFLSERTGRRISAATANSYLKKLSSSYSAIYGEKIRLHAHMLRVTGVVLLREAAEVGFGEDAPLSKQMAVREALSYVGGWSPNSDMPRHYTRQSILRKIEKFRDEKY